MLNNEIETIKNEIENSSDLDPYILDVDIIENNSGKIIQLINSEDEEFKYSLRNKYYMFNFSEPVYIQKVIFTPYSEGSLKGLELISIDMESKESIVTFKNKNSIWLPKKIITAFKFKAPKKMFNKIILNKLEIVGFTLNDFSSIKNKVEDVTTYKDDLNAIVNKLENKDIELDEKVTSVEKPIEEKEISIAELNEELTTLEDTQLPPLRDEALSLTSSINELSTKKDLLEQEKTHLTNNIEQLESKSSELNKEVSLKDSELKKLVNNTNIFSTEIEEYIKQGNKDIRLYTILSLIPWILIGFVTYTVFFGSSHLSSDLISLLKGGTKIDVMTVFWLRLPFVLVVLSILFVSYEISKMFIKNIIHIQKQRRTFAKIGIIAKDIADSSIDGLNINENQKFDLRTKLKMDLLKSHLMNDIGEKYEYEINTSLWEMFKTHLLSKSKGSRKKRTPSKAVEKKESSSSSESE